MPEPLLIAPTGELDGANVGDFRVALSEAAGDAAHAVVVDLSDVDFIDSSALGALVEFYQRVRRKERRLAVVAPRGTAAAVVLNLAGLQSRLPIYEARQAALEM